MSSSFIFSFAELSVDLFACEILQRALTKRALHLPKRRFRVAPLSPAQGTFTEGSLTTVPTQIHSQQAFTSSPPPFISPPLVWSSTPKSFASPTAASTPCSVDHQAMRKRGGKKTPTLRLPAIAMRDWISPSRGLTGAPCASPCG